MSRILKTASAVAIAATTLAALLSTDVSMAFDEVNATDAEMFQSIPQSAAIAPTIAQAVPQMPAPTHTIVDATTGKVTIVEPAKALPVAASLAEMIGHYGVPQDLSAEMRCLAGAIYFESKGETLSGQLAVARVVIARAESGRFPSSYCGVVYQPRQFSFVRRGAMPAINENGAAWSKAVRIAQIAHDEAWDSPVEGALFFHARYVSPGWRLHRIAQIDNHIFYR